MIEQYCVYEKTLPNEVFEVIPSIAVVTEDCPEFISMGTTFPCDKYGVRKMTEEEIKKYVLVPKNSEHIVRKDSEYSEWKKLNDLNESEGIKSFYINSKKFNTINREEFKKLAKEAKDSGKFTLEYRGETFSVYHYC